MIEHRERGIDEMHGMEREWYGKREADREARRRRKELEAKIAEWDRELWTARRSGREAGLHPPRPRLQRRRHRRP